MTENTNRRPVVAGPRRQPPVVRVRARSHGATHGIVSIGAVQFHCSLGRSGMRAVKREGDGATPIGRWPVLRLLYRGDRGHKPRTGLPSRRLRPDDGWCDAPQDRNYNRPVRHPYPASAEAMWRDDHLYDLVLVLGHNASPRRRYGGSAIFMHLARADAKPTAGCVALARPDLIRLLRWLTPGTQLDIR